MKVINKTTKKTLSGSSQMCNSFFSQAKGLMFSKPLKNNCLVFDFKKQKKIALHMLFVFFPIDILFLDTNKRIVELRENVKPFTPLISPKKESRYVIELSKCTIKKTNTKLKDFIQF